MNQPLIATDPPAAAFTEAQEKIINARAPEILAVAGPGSGKTRILIEHYLKHREEDLPTVIVTFTNAGADEIRERLEAGGHPLPFHLGTLHSYLLRLLTTYGPPFILLDETEAVPLREQTLLELRSKESLLALGRELTSPGSGSYACRMVAYAYRAKLKEQGAEDYDTLLLSGLEYIETHPVMLAALYVDEFQDSADTDARIYAALQARRKFYVGDPDQCQPGDTQVTLTNGQKQQISSLSDGMTVRAYDRQAGRITGGHPIKVAARNYSGPMLTVSAGNDSTDCTPNHRWLVRWTDRTTRVCVTYLMFRPDLGFRVGWCQLFAQNDGGNSIPLHFFQRCRNEKAEAGWILGIHETRTAASIEESCISVIFQIPTLPFEPVNGATHITGEAIAETFRKCRAVANTAGAFAEFNRLPDKPFYTASNRLPDKPFYTASATRSRSTFLEIAACNLLPGLHSVPVEGGGWEPVSITRRDFLGAVWSLDVAKHHSYVADGICTLNSIYGFRGGKLDNLLRLVDKPGVYSQSLEDNFRCSTQVARAASSFIARNRLRFGKSTISRTGQDGFFQTVEVEDDLAAIRSAVERLPANETLAILTRFNADRIRITDFLAGSGFIRREAVEKQLPADWGLVLAALTLTTRPENEAYAYRYIQARDGTQRAKEARDHAKLNRRPLTVGRLPETVRELCLKLELSFVSRELIAKGLLALSLTGESLLRECATPLLLWIRTAGKEYETGPVDREAISVMTVHASKGREFDHVLIPGVDSKSYGKKTDSMEEDRRLLYVGITRARLTATVLTCVTAKNPYTGFQEKRTPSSLFFELLA